MKVLESKNTGDTGIVLVFLHYFGGAAASWNWVTDQLKASCRCIALDIPGFGGTAATEEPGLNEISDWLHGQISAAACENVILIGHSMGGKIAAHFCWKYASEKIKGLILVAPSPPRHEVISPEKAEMMKKLPSTASATEGILNDTCLRLSAEKLDTAIQTALQVAPEMRLWWIEKGTQESVTSEMESLRIPVTLLLAGRDPAISTRMTLRETLPFMPLHTRVNVHTRSGHLIPLEDPQWLAKEITLMLERLKNP